ncbi:hypothetical protein LJC63_09925 [Ruminococcaceae bacterium OttesenSCG-928-L11]|nr:hypothetical protein [Ruminococcaceae bacterium OttesenSCG-928-L11]
MDPYTDIGSQITSVIQQNIYVFIVMAVVIVGSIVFNIVRMRNMKKKGGDFLRQHPDAARIFLTTKALITSEAVTVYTVDGEAPHNFVENGKTGFYVAPGRSSVQMSYAYTRPGVLHKTVTTTTDVVDKVLETQPNCSYLLGFDRKEECFTFEEISN